MKNKTHSLYPHYFRASAVTGRMVYRGVTIEVRLILEGTGQIGGQPAPLARWTRWYFVNGSGTPCLRSQLNSIDYRLSGVPEMAKRLHAVPLGTDVMVRLNGSGTLCRFIKTDSQSEHESPGCWFVRIYTGEMVHYTKLAEWRTGYKARNISRRSGGSNTWKIV